MRILLVDDHVLFREGIASLIIAQPNLEIAATAETVAEAVELAQEVKPDVILMDFTLPDGTGLDATRAILAEQPEINIVFLTVHDDDERLFAAIRSGARGYLLKNVTVTKLLDYLHGLERGEAAISRALTTRLMQRLAQLESMSSGNTYVCSGLTARELEILRELDSGATNREIADRLVISERTVKNHVSNILSKLNLRNRYQAANYARLHGLV
ncbi:MAG: response regulator [Anaerolineae bacterium]